MGAATSASAGNDIRAPVAVDVPNRDVDAARESRRVREELEERDDASRGGGGVAEDPDVGPAAATSPGDDLGHPVAVDVATRDEHPAREGGMVGEEAGQLGHRVPGGVEPEDPDVRPAAGAGAGDDLVTPVAVEVAAGSDLDAPEEIGSVREETGHLGDDRCRRRRA